MSRPNVLKLGRPFPLGPETPVTDALVFAAAPDTQALSEPASKDRFPVLVDGGRKLYAGTDYALVRNDKKEVVAITSLVGGYLDAGGNASCDFIAAYFSGDAISESHRAFGESSRITIDASAGGPATVDTEGSDDGVSWYSLGTTFTVNAGQTRTRHLDLPSTYVRANLTGVAGPVQVRVQDEA